MNTRLLIRSALATLILIAAACADPSQNETPTPHVPIPAANGEVTARSYVYRDYEGAATASVEERVYQADIVVRARFVSAASTTLMFRAIQYLKGTGKTNFSVEAETAGRNTQWDNQDAILFLKQHTGKGAEFTFVDSTDMSFFGVVPGVSDSRPPPSVPTYTGALPEGYTVDSRNPVWLPVEDSSQGGNAAGSTGQGSTPDGGSTIITDYDSRGAHQTVTQQALQNTIDWMGAGPSQGGTTLGQTQGRSAAENPSAFTRDHFDNCVLSALRDIRINRDWQAYHNEPLYADVVAEERIDSGSSRGTRTYGFDLPSDLGGALPGNQRYSLHELSGEDSHLFEAVTSDTDNNSRNGYSYWITVRRPLPAGTYRVRSHGQAYYYTPCDYRTDPDYLDIHVNVTAPEGTLHEAFFDPATTTAGVGYSIGPPTTTGVLSPAAFSAGSATTTITGLNWQGGSVVLSLSPFASLGDNQLSFIDLDGSTAFALGVSNATADSAAGTLTWAVPDKPWSAGDLLMLRIGPAQ